MNTIIWILTFFLILKVIWNFSVPYRLISRLKNHIKDTPKQGISLSLGIELFLLTVMVISSYFTSGNSFINKPISLLVCGGSAVLVSYIHFFVAGMIGGWLVTRSRKK
jgi:hypothetical protein